MTSGTRILVVDDEPRILRTVKALLTRRGYGVTLATSGEEALERAAETDPQLIILDLGLPGIGGLEVCRRIREWSRAPILILSVRNEDVDKISALDLGADDYLTKPFSSGELLARVRALLRRVPGPESDSTVVQSGDLVIDLVERRAMLAGRALKLTRTEFAVLSALADKVDSVVTTRALQKAVWGADADDADQIHSLRVHVSHLRTKIEPDPHAPMYIITEPGIGYRFISHPLAD